MGKSYFPTDRTGRIAWYGNFANEFPSVGKELGFSDGEITNALNDAKYAVHILNALGPDIDADPGPGTLSIFLAAVARRLRFVRESTPGDKRA
jgi:hypothetical protein